MIERAKEESFGDFFRRLRRSKGFKTQKLLSEASGISQATLSRIEDGTQNPEEDTLRILSATLDCSYGQLIEVSGYGLQDEKKQLMKEVLPPPQISFNNEFGSYLKMVRKAKGLSCREVAEKMGISRVHLSSVENGVNNHSFELMKPLSKALGVTHIGMLIKAGYLTEEEVLIARRQHGIFD